MRPAIDRACRGAGTHAPPSKQGFPAATHADWDAARAEHPNAFVPYPAAAIPSTAWVTTWVTACDMAAA